MGFVMPHTMTLAALASAGLALLFQIIGLATPAWFYRSENYHTGLWKDCYVAITGPLCVSLTTSTSALDAIRAFGILAVLAMAAALACGLLIGFMSDKQIFTLLAPVAAFAGAVCSLIEFAIFLGEYIDDTLRDYLGYSFALTVVACVLSGLAAVLFFLGKSRSGSA